MKKCLSRSLVVALLFSLKPAMASEMSWYHSAIGFNASLAKQTSAMKTGQNQAQPVANAMIGVPVGSNELTGDMVDSARYAQVFLVLNETKDRVGAEYQPCVPTADNVCDGPLFVFPGLTYDKKAKEVLWGNKVVAKNGFFGMKIQKGFKLTYKIVSEQKDDGFDRTTSQSVIVSLERN